MAIQSDQVQITEYRMMCDQCADTTEAWYTLEGVMSFVESLGWKAVVDEEGNVTDLCADCCTILSE
jgi:hypothetical protein